MPILPGPPPVDVQIRRSARARRFSLRVSRLDGKVTLSIPTTAREKEAVAFLEAQEAWLRRTLSALPGPIGQTVTIGSVVAVQGRSLTLAPAIGRAIRVEGEMLFVPGAAEQAGRRVAAWLRVLARERLAQASTHYAAMLDRKISRLTLRDTRSRWGSCSPGGGLMFSWRLIMAPPSVLNYVAAHEAAHLVEMNHSAAYWSVVSRIYPDWKRDRAWLKRNGGSLHQFRFGD